MVAGPYPFEGRWRQTQTDCSATAGPAPEAPLLIERTTLAGPPGKCTIEKVTHAGDDRARAFDVSLDCAEGPVTVGLRARDDTLLVETGAGSEAWIRCPSDRAAGADAAAALPEIPIRLRGRWVVDPTSCAVPRTGLTDIDHGLVLQARERVASESVCTLSLIDAVGPDRWLASFDCTGEGERWEVRDLLHLEGAQLLISTERGDLRPMTLCPLTDDAWWRDEDPRGEAR